MSLVWERFVLTWDVVLGWGHFVFWPFWYIRRVDLVWAILFRRWSSWSGWQVQCVCLIDQAIVLIKCLTRVRSLAHLNKGRHFCLLNWQRMLSDHFSLDGTVSVGLYCPATPRIGPRSFWIYYIPHHKHLWRVSIYYVAFWWTYPVNNVF